MPGRIELRESDDASDYYFVETNRKITEGETLFISHPGHRGTHVHVTYGYNRDHMPVFRLPSGQMFRVDPTMEFLTAHEEAAEQNEKQRLVEELRSLPRHAYKSHQNPEPDYLRLRESHHGSDYFFYQTERKLEEGETLFIERSGHATHLRVTYGYNRDRMPVFRMPSGKTIHFEPEMKFWTEDQQTEEVERQALIAEAIRLRDQLRQQRSSDKAE